MYNIRILAVARLEQSDSNRWCLRDAVTAGALFLAAAAFTLWQNARVAVLWDLSYLLDSSVRMNLGQMPYRDFPFAHAPLTFLLHAAILRVFGRVYLPHIACAAMEAGVATLLTWRILLDVLQPLAERGWLLATLLASPLIFLGIYGVYPHPIYDSDCILAVLFALFLLQRAGDAPARNALAGAACVLPLFFKQNIGLPFLLITPVCTAGIAEFSPIAAHQHCPQLYPSPRPETHHPAKESQCCWRCAAVHTSADRSMPCLKNSGRTQAAPARPPEQPAFCRCSSNRTSGCPSC